MKLRRRRVQVGEAAPTVEAQEAWPTWTEVSPGYYTRPDVGRPPNMLVINMNTREGPKAMIDGGGLNVYCIGYASSLRSAKKLVDDFLKWRG